MVSWNIIAFLFTNIIAVALGTGYQNPERVLTNNRVKHTLSFAGYKWQIKSRTERAGPGNNYFSASTENVWVDTQGQLHLKITFRNGRWQCAEIISQKSFGYGTYNFTLAPLAKPLDKNVVVGLFLWDSYATQRHNHEVDIEFSRWGLEQNINAQYVVHPDVAGNKHRFAYNLQAGTSRHSFTWTTKNIIFRSEACHSFKSKALVESNANWKWPGEEVPRASREKVRLNVWLYQGQPPAENQEVEVVFTDFSFKPL